MKLQTALALQLIIASFLLLSLNSCMKDNCRHTYTLLTPVYKTLTEVRANMKSNAPQNLTKPGKLYIYGNYIFLNESDKGIHIIDNSQPKNPQNVAFITIPGNVDMAVIGNTLYADSYSDLVAFDITNPKNVVAKKFLNNIFPQRNQYYLNYNSQNPDSAKVIVDYVKTETTVDCEQYNYLYRNFYSQSMADASGFFALSGGEKSYGGGMGGSMARFTILKDYLYAVTYSDLNVINIATPQNPTFSNKSSIGNSVIETIYPFKDKLFIGSNNGMYIYDVSTAGSPVKQGQFTHARACDPVVADDQYAWVTLRSGTVCQGFTNQLEVVKISNLQSPSLLKTYSMTSPHGLSKDDQLLFICDGKDGLKIYNAADANNIQLIKHISGIETYDVIAWSGLALVVAKDGLYQFDYKDLTNIRLISKIGLDN
jgi:hypothetical protein